ncbi:MAG: hypothetical protein MI754_03000 [Chromatiales bacterium]|nr:hypothetical protein [Chromatiales bacterium]
MSRSIVALVIGLIASGCATVKLMNGETAALYNTIEADGRFISVTYEYAVAYKIDEKLVGLNENPVFVKAGKRKVHIKKGRCIAPVMIIACDFQPKVLSIIEYEFQGGTKYRLTKEGNIVRI